MTRQFKDHFRKTLFQMGRPNQPTYLLYYLFSPKRLTILQILSIMSQLYSRLETPTGPDSTSENLELLQIKETLSHRNRHTNFNHNWSRVQTHFLLVNIPYGIESHNIPTLHPLSDAYPLLLTLTTRSEVRSQTPTTTVPCPTDQLLQ